MNNESRGQFVGAKTFTFCLWRDHNLARVLQTTLLKFSLLIGCLLLTIPLIDAKEAHNLVTENQVLEKPILEIFVRDGCPHCAEAKKFIPTLVNKYPNLRVAIRSIDQEPSARESLIAHSKVAGIWPPGVPTFIFSGKLHVGFTSAEQTGPQIIALLSDITSSEKNVLIQEQAPSTSVESRVFGNISVERFGLPLFTLAIGLLDGFNPCAMWVLLFLLSLLVRLHNRRKMMLITGTFVFVSAIVYYAFIAAWFNVFMFIGLSTTLIRLLGGLALCMAIVNIRDFFSQQANFTLAIPNSAKPGLYSRMRKVINAPSLLPSIGAVVVLAIVVNFIEILCTAGFPAIFTAVLTQQELPTPIYYGYIGLYILAYMLDDTIAVAISVIALSSQKLSRASGQRLKLISGAVMLLLGVIMLIRPSWLS
ncbi:glutaredoxin family protein [Colwelliaceae bacterium 6471]